MPGAVTVLVDAENVRRSQWPNIPEGELVERCCAWAKENGLRAVVVFDGDAPAWAETPTCAVVGSGPESADDWLAAKAEGLRRTGEQFWLVTSDRSLRTRAGAGAARTLGGGAFADTLRPRPGSA